MNGVALFLVFMVARVAVLWNRSIVWTPEAALAYIGQDAAVATVYLVVERIALRAPWARGAVVAAFWLVVAYTAVNVVVARTLSTPLTWPMLRATGGPISDSIAFYLNRHSLFLVALVFVSAPVLVQLAKQIRGRTQRTVSLGIVCVAGFGSFAATRIDTAGLHRNAIATLLASSLPAVHARADTRDWRDSPFAERPAVQPPDISGVGAGRDVVLIGLESTAAQYLRTFGAPDDVMPRLDELARSAVVFERAYAVSPDSIRSLFSVLCSRYPAFDTGPEAFVNAECASLAATFRSAGYRTAMFHSGRFGYLGMESVIRQRGFDVLEDAGDIGGNYRSSFGVDEPATVSRMLAWIDGLAPGQRFFLNYLPVAGHHPYESLEPGAFGAATDLERYKSALHDGDRSLGLLIDGLRARGRYEDTVFVVYGDHGQAFGQHERNFGHTFFLYEENVHVPFLVALPGSLQRPARTDVLVSLVDVAPTLVDVMGFASDQRRQGRSAFDGEPGIALFFTDYGANLAGLRDGRWKLVHDLGSSRPRLFDLNLDPGEHDDRSRDHPARTDKYRRIVEAWASDEKARMTQSGRSVP